jgi:hypothetical protein
MGKDEFQGFRAWGHGSAEQRSRGGINTKSAGIRSGRQTEKSGTEKSATLLADIFLSQIFLFAGLSSGCVVSDCDSPAMS